MVIHLCKFVTIGIWMNYDTEVGYLWIEKEKKKTQKAKFNIGDYK